MMGSESRFWCAIISPLCAISAMRLYMVRSVCSEADSEPLRFRKEQSTTCCGGQRELSGRASDPYKTVLECQTGLQRENSEVRSFNSETSVKRFRSETRARNHLLGSFTSA